MSYDYLVFDLDGTISDPKEGIHKSINCALESFNFEPVNSTEIDKFIGPPLDSAFIEMTGTDDSKVIASLISAYRERYADVGFSENILYQGINESLIVLDNNPNYQLGICTSKRKDFAEKILALFGLNDLFQFVSGGDVGTEKWQQIDGLLNSKIISSNSLMIGDRYIDVTAAHKNGIHSAGVLWGYGSKEELVNEKPNYIFTEPSELQNI